MTYLYGFKLVLYFLKELRINFGHCLITKRREKDKEKKNEKEKKEMVQKAC